MRYRLIFSVSQLGPGQFQGEAFATPLDAAGRPMMRPYVRGRGRGPTRRTALQMALSSALKAAPGLSTVMPQVGIPLTIASRLARTGIGKKVLRKGARSLWRGLRKLF